MNRLLPVLLLLLTTTSLFGQQVYVIELKDEINHPSARFVSHGIDAAEAARADLILLHLDTYGGRVDYADSIRSALLDTEIPTAVFIDRNAASAGALISMACDSIYMAPGASIGAATVVNGSDGAVAPDKYQSYWRSIMRATAEMQGRDPRIAEKMVDQNLDLPGVSPVGQVITFSTREAIQYDYCDGEVNSLKEVAAEMGFPDAPLTTYEPAGVDKAINFLIHPMVTSLLVLFIFGGFFMELKTPGLGIAGLIGLVATALFFAPHYIEGLVEFWEIALFGAGILLIAAEIFVIPGFGIAGILGIAATVVGLVTGLLDNDGLTGTYIDTGEVLRKTAWILILMISAILGVVAIAKYLLQSNHMHPLIDLNTQDKDKGYVTGDPGLHAMIGHTALAQTDLRPSGFVEIEERRIDAESVDGFIGRGSAVRVVRVQGVTLFVETAE